MGQVNILNAGVVSEYAQGVSCLTLSEHGVTMVGLPCPRRKQASARVEIARVPDVREVAAAPGSTIMSNNEPGWPKPAATYLASLQRLL